MEKRWIGSICLILVLVLLVFAVGYSSGNSPTGYQFFDKIFRTVPAKEVVPTPSGAERGMCSCELTLNSIRRNQEEAFLTLNGISHILGEGDSVEESSCRVLLVDIRPNSALLDVNGEELNLGLRNSQTVDECLSGGNPCSCWVTFDRFDRNGEARIRVNGAESYILRRGDSILDSDCGVGLLDIDRGANAITLDVNGDIVSIFEGGSKNIDDCLSRYESDCACDIRFIRFMPDGKARLVVNGQLFESGEGDSVSDGPCRVNLLDIDRISGSIILDANGNEVQLRTDYYG